MGNLTELEWRILDSLSYDKECVATMEIQGVSSQTVRNTVYELYKRNLIQADHEAVKSKILMKESEDYIEAYYWFGLTQSGAKYWEESAKRYSDVPVDWSRAWSSRLSYEKQEGYVEGTSLEVCFSAIDELNQNKYRNKEWLIDTNTFIHSEIQGFQATYFKYIEGGHRISFKLKKNINLE